MRTIRDFFWYWSAKFMPIWFEWQRRYVRKAFFYFAAKPE